MRSALCLTEVSGEGCQFGPFGYKKARLSSAECPCLTQVSGKGYQFGPLSYKKGRAVKSSTPFVRKKRVTRV